MVTLKARFPYFLLFTFIACSSTNETSSKYNYSIDHFEREPYVAYFKSKDIDFSVIGIHVKPDNALQELNQLDDLYEEVARNSKDDDAIILGDFNASCTYLSRSQEKGLDLQRSKKFNWVMDDSVDTTSGRTNCAYDRIVTIGNLQPNGFKIYTDMPTEVSDHYPVSTSLTTTNGTIKIGAFNIKWLGRKKIRKPIVINNIVSLALMHHILLIQEVRDTSGEVRVAIQDALPSNYKVIQSKSIGRTNYKESYIYIYDSRSVVLTSAFEFPDGQLNANLNANKPPITLPENSTCVYSSHPGCCRGHEGILKCENGGKVCTSGYIQCKDGTLSKSCMCFQ